MLKHVFVISIFLASLVYGQSYAAAYPLETATISSIQNDIQHGIITCQSLIAAYLEQINNYDFALAKNKAPLNAITVITPTVLAQAQDLDTFFQGKHQLKGALHCIPIIVKDNIDTYDSPSTSGSLSLLGNQPLQDAFLVQQLRQAGAIIIAKGAMDEFAAGLSGLSGRNGRIGNAYDPNQNPGGSSGGPAVAVSANFALMGIGTDNSGSIRIPAAFNGLVGLRPSTGLISQTGIFPRGNMDGVAGPMTKTVTDLATVLDVIAKVDPADYKTLAQPQHPSYLNYLTKTALQAKRIGVVRSIAKVDILPTTKEAKLHFEQALIKMHNLGATLINDIDLPRFNISRKLNETGEREDINTYLASYPATRKDYPDICMSERTKAIGATTKECLEFVGKLPPQKEREAALNIFASNRAYIKTIMAQYKLDALVLMTNTQGFATYENKTFKAGLLISSNAGIPSITFPIAYAENGLPIGIELIAEQYQEAKLLAMAYAYEQTVLRMPPKLPQSQPLLKTMDIAKFNNFVTKIGNSTFNQVIQNYQGKELYKVLTPAVFSDIVSKLKSQA